MNRRDLFKTLAGLSTVGVVGVSASSPPEIHPLTSLDAFNRQFKGYEEAERWGRFSVFFTGLKPDQTSTILAGQWFGWPGSWLPVEERKRMEEYYVASVPGQWSCRYWPGSVFSIGAHGPGRKLITLELLRNEPQCVAEMIKMGRMDLLATMRSEGAL